MSVPTAIMDEDLANWSAALAKLGGDLPALKASFIERWKRNATSAPPSLLPTGGQIAGDHGWSMSLELFLLSKDQRDRSTTLLANAILGAVKDCGKLDMSWGDVWIEDVLALRRVPPPSRSSHYDKRFGRVDLEVAAGVLGALGDIPAALPAPRRDAYQVFRRAYMMITNALVSEIVEADIQGLVLVEYQSGRRLVPPDARSIFRDLPQLHMANESWPKAPRAKYAAIRSRWIALIRGLVDTILRLNVGLDAVVATGEVDAQTLGAFARQFDWALYRLILADLMNRSERDRRRLEDVLAALGRIHEKGARFSRPAHFYQQRSLVGGALWYGGAISKPLPALRPEDAPGPWVRSEEFLPLEPNGDFRLNEILIVEVGGAENRSWLESYEAETPFEENT